MPSALVWFRRDLRMDDHAALYHALRHAARAGGRVHCAFVFDSEILDALPSRTDRRVAFIRESLVELDAALRDHGGALIVRHGRARDEIPALARELGVDAVHANRDYEPAAIERDRAVAAALAVEGIAFHDCKDQVIFEKDEVLTRTGTPFTVFTPYKNAWLARLDAFFLEAYPVERYAGALAASPLATGVPSLAEIGFTPADLAAIGIPTGRSGARRLFEDFVGRIDDYKRARDFPATKGPSYLSVHLRFGTIPVRLAARTAHARAAAGSEGAATWLSELVWREFYFQILAHFPHVVDRAFRREFDRVRFDDDAGLFAAWREGRTGYPIVDAGMRQLDRSGYMHNRLRMITGSFLVKDLHVHWRHGERWFADRLNDYDLAANNGGWQWVASSGVDAQPYFRIFNPVLQSQKFDPRGAFIRRYCPELARVPDAYIHAPWTMPPAEQEQSGCVIGRDYPAPLVQHDAARRITLERYSVVKSAVGAA